MDAHKRTYDIDLRPLDGVFVGQNIDQERTIGAVLGTMTLRYPVPCTRFAPYGWAGVGAIFGGGESDSVTDTTNSRLAQRVSNCQRAEPPFRRRNKSNGSIWIWP